MKIILQNKQLIGIKIEKHRSHSRSSKQKSSRRLKPKRVIADKGYDDDGLRAKFATKGIDFIVDYRDNRVNRPYEDSRKLRCYCWRWKVERTNAWLKNFRRVAVRWDRSLIAYKGFLHLACISITLMRF